MFAHLTLQVVWYPDSTLESISKHSRVHGFDYMVAKSSASNQINRVEIGKLASCSPEKKYNCWATEYNGSILYLANFCARPRQSGSINSYWTPMSRIPWALGTKQLSSTAIYYYARPNPSCHSITLLS